MSYTKKLRYYPRIHHSNEYGDGIVSLPVLGTTLAAAYSLYSVVNGYVGPTIQVCAPGDTATPASPLDVYANAAGVPDLTAAISAFGTALHIYKWYDQTGGGNHAVSPTVASRYDILSGNSWSGMPVATSAASQEFAIIPDTLVSSRQACSLITVAASRGSRDSKCIASVGTGGTTAILNLLTDTVAVEALGNAFVQSTRHSRVQPTVVGICCGASNTKMHRNETVTSVAALTAATGLLGGAIGGSHNAAATVDATYRDGFSDIFCHLIYSGQVSDADMVTLKNTLYSRFNITTGATYDYKLFGDSIGYGQASTSGVGSPSRCIPYFTNKIVDVHNLSTPGKRLDTLTPFATYVGNRNDSSKTRSLIHCQLGTNDIDNGSSAATILGNMQTFATNVLAMSGNPRVVFSTIIARNYVSSHAAKDLVRLDLNTQMLSTLHNGTNTFVLDRASILTNPDDTTYYNADDTHLNDTGYQLVADFEGPLLNALF